VATTAKALPAPATNRGDPVAQPENVRRIHRLNVAAKLIARDFFRGLNPTMLRACSLDVADLREYSPGDDLKLMDWRAYARTDRHYIKQFEVERDASVVFFLDASPSMSFTSNGVTKFEYSKYLVAALAFIGASQQDRVGLLVSPGHDAADIPPRRGRLQLHRVFHALTIAETNRAIAPFQVFYYHMTRLRRRSVLVVVSDFLNEDKDIRAFMQRAAFEGHSVMVFHVLDKAERRLPFDGTVEFDDIENHRRVVRLVTREFRNEYEQRVAQFCGSLHAECARLGIEYAPIDTGTPYDVALMSYMKRRRKMRQTVSSAGLRWKYR